MPEQNDPQFVAQVANAIADTQQQLGMWLNRQAQASSAPNDSPDQADAGVFVSACYVTAYTSLLAALTAGI